MTRRPMALGRGLDALFSPSASEGDGELRRIPLDLLQRGKYQPRRQFSQESLDELAVSIRAEGVLQPIVVRPAEGGRYEILAGERRWRAAQLAGLRDIPALLRDCSDQQALAIGLIENIQRQSLNPLEEAAALQRLLEEFSLSHEALSDALGRSRAAISNQIRLLRLDPGLQTHVETGALSAGHARALLVLEPPEQREAAAAVMSGQLNVRQTEHLVQGRLRQGAGEKRGTVTDPDSRALEEVLARHLGVAVRVREIGGGGEMRIRWKNSGEGAALWERLGLPQLDENGT